MLWGLWLLEDEYQDQPDHHEQQQLEQAAHQLPVALLMLLRLHKPNTRGGLRSKQREITGV